MKYKQAKEELKQFAVAAKKNYKNDKPLIRMIINDSIDVIVSNYDLSEYQRSLLCNYACKLHPRH